MEQLYKYINWLAIANKDSFDSNLLASLAYVEILKLKNAIETEKLNILADQEWRKSKARDYLKREEKKNAATNKL